MSRPVRNRKPPTKHEPWKEGDAVPMSVRKQQSRKRANQRERNHLCYQRKKEAAAAAAEQAELEYEAAKQAEKEARRAAAAAKRSQLRKEKKDHNANLPKKPKKSSKK